MNNNSPNLEISQIRVRQKGGGLVLNLGNFRTGLNVIRGNNSSGRTTLLQLFEFGLGANIRISDFIPEVKEYCELLLLEVRLNGVVYTIQRKFHGSNQIEVYQGVIDAPLRGPSTIFSQGREFSDFLLRQLDIPRIAFVDEYSGRERPILFNEIYDALYLDQEKGFSEIHARLRGRKRLDVFKLLTEITIPNLYDITIEENSLKKQRADLQAELQAIERFLGNVQLPTQLEFATRIKNLMEQREELNHELGEIKNQIRARPNYSYPLRDQIIELEGLITAKQKESHFTQQTLNSYYELKNQLSLDLDRIARARSSATLLSSFDFQQCPRCLQKLTDEMKLREFEDNCGLCGRHLLQSSDQIDDLETYASQINVQIDELNELQALYESEVENVNADLQNLSSNLEQKRREFDKVIENYVSPVLQDVETLGYEIATINEEIARLNDNKKWLDQIEKMHANLEETARKIKELRNQRKELEEEEKLLQIKIQPFERFFIQFISDIYPNYKKAEINTDDFLPLINDHNYKAKSATQKDIVILGYYYALLRLSLERETKIPRYLVIDTLRQDDLDKGVYYAILEKFSELENLYSGSFQLFLVIRDDVPTLQKFELEPPFPLLGGKRLFELNNMERS